MKKVLTISLMLAVVLPLAGCSGFKRLTGQTDDTVLPGAREDILSPDQQTAKDPNLAKKSTAACDPADPSCVPPVDQESSTPQ
jgi:hypothetical protein